MSDPDIKKHVDLKGLTTFNVGGEAEYFTEVDNVKDLKDAVEFAKENDLDIFILGGGSNVLIADGGIQGLVIKYVNKSIEFTEKGDEVRVSAGAGLEWDELVNKTVEKGYQGVECMSGIPGSVGAAPIQNIGAYGQELKDVFIELTAYDLKSDKVVKFNKKECQFDYRDSKFKKPQHRGRYFILRVTLMLNKKGTPCTGYQSLQDYLDNKGISSPTLKDIRESVLDLRSRKLEDPRVLGNAGSFFKNPIVGEKVLKEIRSDYPQVPNFKVADDRYKLFAGWLIDNAGWKGKIKGGAKVSEKNALVITNPGEATAEDVRQLAESISEDVKNKFGIELEPEVSIL